MSEALTNGVLSPMPPNVALAISKVMAGVPKLQRGERNTHGNYNFASIDDFLEAVRPLCAEHGLIILQDEDSAEMLDGGTDRQGKPRRWLKVRYRFTLAHSSGETWAHQPTRSIVVDASMGSQSFGAAQSYTLKLFERSLFQIATGEKGQDVDEHAPVDLPQYPKNGPPPKRKSSAQAKRDGDWPALEQALKDCQSAREVERLREEWVRDWYPSWKDDWRDSADEKFNERLAEFSQPGALKQTLQDSLRTEDGSWQGSPSATDEQTTKYHECWEWIENATTLNELVMRADNPGFREGLKKLTKLQVAQLREFKAARMEALSAAQ